MTEGTYTIHLIATSKQNPQTDAQRNGSVQVNIGNYPCEIAPKSPGESIELLAIPGSGQEFPYSLLEAFVDTYETCYITGYMFVDA